MRRIGLFLTVGCVVGLLLLFSTTAGAQCSMCRAVLSSSNNSQFIRNFNIGVLVLLIPPVSIFCSLFVVLRRHRGENESAGAENFD